MNTSIHGWSGLLALLAASSLAHAQTAPVVVRIDAAHPAQTIANFAASDAWSCQFVGLWPAAKKEAIAAAKKKGVKRW